jgi:hypothetical protein
LVHLCRHHHGLVHEGGFTVERRPGGTILFRRPDGRRIAPCPAAPPGRIAAMRTIGIDHDACVQRSTERMDLAYAVDAMLDIAPPGRSPDADVAVGVDGGGPGDRDLPADADGAGEPHAGLVRRP